MPSLDQAPGGEHAFLAGGGQAGALIAAFDWSATPLGPIERWPRSLKSVVALILHSPVAMVLLWGEEGILVYNDAYSVIAGGRHPTALGSRVRESWPEIADFNAHVLESALAGQALTYRDQPLVIHRNGHDERAWFTLDYSPVFDDDARPAGAIAIVVETTDRVGADAWLKGERERLRQMFEQAPGFMAMLVGPEHVFDLVNPAYLQLVGHRDVVGMTVRAALPDIQGQGYYELLDQVYATGQAFTGSAMPVKLQRAPGAPEERRFVDLVYQPVRDPAGRVIGIFVQGADVTERWVTEHAMRATEARNRQILDSAIDYAIIAFDLAGKVTRWNAGAERIFGWSEEEMLGQDGSRIFTPEDQAAGQERIEMNRAAATGRGSDERWHIRRSGQRFWANGEMTPIHDDADQITGFVKVLRDRTAEHRAAKALVESEARLRRAQEAGGVGTFTVDLATNILSGTPEFFRLFGLDGDAAVPASALEALVVPEDAAIRSSANSRGTEDAPLDVEYRIHRASDGALRWIARKAEYEADSAGRIVRMVGVVQDVTERRAASRALEESEAQFRTFAQSLPNHVWTAPANGQLDWFNDRTYEYSGAEPGTLDGRRWGSIVHPDDIELASRQWAAALASGDNYESEFRIRRADGAYRWHLARALPLRAGDGSISRWVGTNTDIHERKLLEARSTRDRERIWTLSQELMLVCDFNGSIEAVNPAATRLLGWREDEMVGAMLRDFLHPDDLDATAEELEKLALGTPTLAFENRYRTKDGGWRILNWTAVPEAGHIHGIARDVTLEREASRERERIWSSTHDLLGTADMAGVLRAINPAWQRLLGHEMAAMLSRPITDLVHRDDRSRLAALIDRAAASGAGGEAELRMSHADGREFLVGWTVDAVGDILYMVGRNVTDQRSAEDALRQSQKMEAVGQLTGGIAHDFNNLLQGITGSINLMQKYVALQRFAEIDRLAASAMSSAKRAAALTHRLLAFSRRQPLDPRVIEANPLIASMEDLLRRTLGERIRLQLSLAPDLWRTRCDPNQLENAMLNLAINSRDAMPDGGTLVIETRNARLDARYIGAPDGVRAGSYVCIAVSDTGAGMSAQTIAKAFDPFFTTKPIGQGTGLGLSMIYGFARQSEGFAKIYSELGRGTTFKLYLPQHAGDVQAEDPAAEPPGPQQASDHDNVLVVEDDPVVRALVVQVLRDLGYEVEQAADGPAGLRLLQGEGHFDLLITDVGLPGLNGRQLADAGRHLRPGLKVLFMTGYAENAAVASGFLEAGMSMMTKPFAMDALATKVRAIIEGR